MSVNWSDEQKRAITRHGTNLVVSAGAGSGKTAVLAERIASLAEKDPMFRMHQLLVMTFTEAAAEEMRARIVRRLADRAAEAEQAGDSAKARRFRRLTQRAQDAQISTIHSFCRSLLRDHAVEAGLVPGFVVLSGEEDAVLLRAAAEATLDEWARHPERGPQLRAALVGLRLHRHTQAVSGVLELCEVALSQVDPGAWLAEIARHYDAGGLWEGPFGEAFARWARMNVAQALQSMRKGLEELERIQAPETLIESVRSASSNLREALSCLSAPDSSFDPDHISRLINWKSSKVPKSDEYVPFRKWRERANKAVDRLRKILGRGRAALEADVQSMRPHIEVLTGVARETLARAKSRRLEENRLSFSDLEHLAHELLAKDHGVRAALHARYRYVFVDEYQDTSPIQDAIVDAVAPPGGLFLVGDVKQSIYGFRMAEPELFLDRYRKYAQKGGGEAIDLTANYRSRSGIVRFVNYLFGQLFRADVAGFDYADGHEMKPEAAYPGDDGEPCPVKIKLFFSGDEEVRGKEAEEDQEGADNSQAGDGEDDEQVAREKLEIEAMWVADQIAQAVARGEKVYDRAGKTCRELRYQDVAILLRAGGENLNTVVQVLASRGIPAVARSSSGFFHAMEIRWAICLLTSLDNPLDSLALAAALKSPFVGLCDEDLAAARLVRPRGPLWHALREAARDNQAARDALRSAVERFERWRGLARTLAPGDLLREIAREVEIDLYLRAMPRGAVRAANLEQLIRLAQSHAPHAGDLYRFLAMVRGLEEADVDLGHAQGAVGDSVGVMTIHGSKGLEFPHVYVLGMGRQFPHNPRTLALHRRLGIGATMRDPKAGVHWRTIPSIAVEHANLEASRTEEARVLYVALTRAKERLVVVGHAGDVSKLADAADALDDEGRLTPEALVDGKSYASWIVPALMRHPDGAWLRKEAGEVRAPVLQVSGARFELEVEVNGMPQGQAASEPPSPVRKAPLPCAHEVADELRRLWQGGSWERALRIETHERAPRVSLPSKLTATDIRRLFAERELEAHGRPAGGVLDDPAFVRPSGASPRERGVAFHAFMQRAPLQAYAIPDEVVRAAQALLEQGLLDARMVAALDPADVIAFFASPLGHRVLTADEVYREQPFFYRVDVRTGDEQAPVVVQGVIDCLIRDARGYAVIDYKTDQARDAADIDRLVRAYEPQVATYAAAVLEAVGTEPEVYLYFVHARECRLTRTRFLGSRLQEWVERA
ncbi:MAG: UvrD-helicase domain-containing protein [Alicyclobacillus mali]|uniref:UvrD-helicase domain-containing protein n=1 Tax=Alicyclobacillus mali (ex Roth et al. 2021) TaxID=1123961 RepID=UPI000836E23A|nr:UvrD-helicase domain-containing protein [Alicyclobacillus mali (ex Roth et al. 2021)]MCL6487954.1 UvrD-helicase domain-containing protein [Alicyclobacillus mali (ex Roth et al. 2021)]